MIVVEFWMLLTLGAVAFDKYQGFNIVLQQVQIVILDIRLTCTDALYSENEPI